MPRRLRHLLIAIAIVAVVLANSEVVLSHYGLAQRICGVRVGRFGFLFVWPATTSERRP